jgi:undecaprenyl-diphosphatase
MNIFQAIVYGIVQGLTEFLPVSSTAHLRLVPALTGWTDPGAVYTAVIQLGTVLAVLIFFWKDLSGALIGFVKSLSGGPKDTIEAKTGWAVFYATIPIAVIGLALHKYIEGPFRSLWVIGSTLIAMGLFMYFAERRFQGTRVMADIEKKDGLMIGLWQCLSLLPGMSRSGSTITGAFVSGFEKPAAARLSFLMSVPAITLAGLFEGVKDFKKLSGELRTPAMIGTVVSFIVGYFCIKWMISFVQRRGITPFVAYRVVLGIIILGLCFTGKLDPAPTPEKPNVQKEAVATR